jgi:hypothetical protein
MKEKAGSRPDLYVCPPLGMVPKPVAYFGCELVERFDSKERRLEPPLNLLLRSHVGIVGSKNGVRLMGEGLLRLMGAVLVVLLLFMIRAFGLRRSRADSVTESRTLVGRRGRRRVWAGVENAATCRRTWEGNGF